MKHFIKFLCLFLILCLFLTGCNNSNSNQDVIDDATYEIRLNDYRGGVIRTLTLKDKVLQIMEDMKRNNSTIREDNPNSFWTTNGYQDFVSSFLTTDIISDTSYFTEEECDWATVIEWLSSEKNNFTVYDSGAYKLNNNINIARNEKDDYYITGATTRLGNNYNYSGSTSYRILYDCDKDWCKAYTSLTITSCPAPAITSQMFEYARINNDTFAIQTAKERLLVVFEPVESDADIRYRPIKEFYYSRLSGGMRTKFKPRKSLPTTDENGKTLKENQRENEKWEEYSLLNEQGEIATQYGKNNSIFLQDNVYKTNYKWVFEDGALQQAIVYKEQTLVATTYNKLTEKYERFIYSVEKAKPELIKEIENMVKIEGLVGVIEVKHSELPSQPAQTEATDAEGAAETSIAATTSNANSETTTKVSSLDEAFSAIASDINGNTTTAPAETTTENPAETTAAISGADGEPVETTIDTTASEVVSEETSAETTTVAETEALVTEESTTESTTEGAEA